MKNKKEERKQNKNNIVYKNIAGPYVKVYINSKDCGSLKYAHVLNSNKVYLKPDSSEDEIVNPHEYE